VNSNTDTVPSISNAETSEKLSFENYRSIGFAFSYAYLISKGGTYVKSYTRMSEFAVPAAKNHEL